MTNLFFHKPFLQLAAILSCFFILSCENDQKTLDEISKPKAMIEEAKQIETYLSQGSLIKAKLWAPYMLRYSSDTVYVEFPQSLRVNFFDSLGQVDSHLHSLYGKYFESLDKVFLRDSVLVYNTQNDSLRTPELWWDQNTQMFYTDKNVWIKKGGTVLYGKGMTARQDLSDIRIKLDDSKLPSGVIDLPDSLSVQ